MRRPAVAIGVLAFAGLVAAGGIGLLVNEVSGDSVGLAAEPLSAGPLAPPEATRDRRPKDDRGRRGRGSGDKDRDAAAPEPVAPASPAPAPVAPVDDDFAPAAPVTGDDHGGDSSGPGSGGSGSDDSSGHGSDD